MYGFRCWFGLCSRLVCGHKGVESVWIKKGLKNINIFLTVSYVGYAQYFGSLAQEKVILTLTL